MNSANPAPRGESPANIGAGRHEGGKGRQQRRVLPPLRGMANDGILTAGAALPSGYISARAKVVRRGWQPSAPHPPPWRWSSHRVLIASRSVGAESGSASAPSGCGCAARRQSLQYTLPGA